MIKEEFIYPPLELFEHFVKIDDLSHESIVPACLPVYSRFPLFYVCS